MKHDPLPPLGALRVFAVAARELSFTRAAASLHLTQSAVSKQVLALEAHFGQPLFERAHRSLRLTDAGSLLQQATEDALARLRDAATQILAGDEPLLTVTTTPSLASLWLIPRLGDFFAENPGIDVRISADTRLVNLERSNHDVAIRSLRDSEAPATAVRLFGETVFVVCTPGLRDDPQRPLRTPADLARHTLLAYHDDAARRPWLEWPTHLEALGVPGLRPAASISFNQYDQLLRAALDGHGVALGSAGLLHDALARGRLVAPFARRLQAPRGYYVQLAPGAGERPAVRRFCDWLQRQAAADGAATSS
jgi:DNA-binding transcriptional LysR family regulator